MLFNREKWIPAGDNAEARQLSPLLPAVRECDFTPKSWTSKF
jgi:hypothetical protein